MWDWTGLGLVAAGASLAVWVPEKAGIAVGVAVGGGLLAGLALLPPLLASVPLSHPFGTEDGWKVQEAAVTETRLVGKARRLRKPRRTHPEQLLERVTTV